MAAEANDAIELLQEDHREVEALFNEYEQLASDDVDAKESLAAEICEKLTVHAQIEEEIFYPAARQALGDDIEIVDEAEEEHADAKQLIAEIEEMSPEDDDYDAKVKALSEAIAHHVEEEESEMFPKLRQSGLETQALGEQMAERKYEIIDELGLAETD
ncbi:MAG TPA: hemerythrin domain-containing protein [Burkholderiaceae bacterium]|nr:hemerythrin domain-containing protein [Burkholderiaceae bacterium]